VTLTILQQAESLGVHAVWLQPGAEDDAVVEYIRASQHLSSKTIFSEWDLRRRTPPACNDKVSLISSVEARGM
jgi:hypothetical protein